MGKMRQALNQAHGGLIQTYPGNAASFTLCPMPGSPPMGMGFLIVYKGRALVVLTAIGVYLTTQHCSEDPGIDFFLFANLKSRVPRGIKPQEAVDFAPRLYSAAVQLPGESGPLLLLLFVTLQR